MSDLRQAIYDWVLEVKQFDLHLIKELDALTDEELIQLMIKLYADSFIAFLKNHREH
jgi:predicted membrane-bound dolichyl-phosphate-mannose-protein mannosyltransferase